MINRIKQAWREHPFLDGLVGGVAIFIAAAVLVSFVPPAWAAILIPVTDRVVINLGAVLDWAQFVLSAAGFYMIYIKASQAVKQTDGVMDKISAMSKREGVVEGVQKEKLAGIAAAEQLAEGQRRGREIERESVAAQGAATIPAEAAEKPAPGKKA